MISEKVLLEQARRFDEQALTEVYDRYSPELYRYAVRLLDDRDLAEECVAETFSRLLMALKHGKGPRQYIRAYLYRVAHNWITDSYRRQPPPTVQLNTQWQADPDIDPQVAVVKNMEQQEVRSALFKLTPEQRQVMTLKYIEGWRNKEIAQAMGKPVGAVKSLQHRALNSLRRILVKEHEVAS